MAHHAREGRPVGGPAGARAHRREPRRGHRLPPHGRLLRGLGLVAGLMLPSLYSWALGTPSAKCSRGPGRSWAISSGPSTPRSRCGGRTVGEPPPSPGTCATTSAAPPSWPGRARSGAHRGVDRGDAGPRDVRRARPHQRPPVGDRSGRADRRATPSRSRGVLVRRPRPGLSPAQLAAVHAIRSQSIRRSRRWHVHASPLLAVPLWSLAASDVQLLRWTMWIPGC